MTGNQEVPRGMSRYPDANGWDMSHPAWRSRAGQQRRPMLTPSIGVDMCGSAGRWRCSAAEPVHRSAGMDEPVLDRPLRDVRCAQPGVDRVDQRAGVAPRAGKGSAAGEQDRGGWLSGLLGAAQQRGEVLDVLGDDASAMLAGPA